MSAAQAQLHKYQMNMQEMHMDFVFYIWILNWGEQMKGMYVATVLIKQYMHFSLQLWKTKYQWIENRTVKGSNVVTHAHH